MKPDENYQPQYIYVLGPDVTVDWLAYIFYILEGPGLFLDFERNS
jgi:hypothetical protein